MKWNWSKVRDMINSGKTRDKINSSDPATTPLGTDEEAGGAQTPPEDIAKAVEDQEPAGKDKRTTPAHREDAPDHKRST